MAALDFPDTPAVGDLYGSAGVLWKWDGARWASTAGSDDGGGPWTPLALINGFVPFDGGSWSIPSWRLGPGNRIELMGLLQPPAMASGTALQFTTLPAPAKPKILGTIGWNTGTSPTRHGQVRVFTDGEAVINVENGDPAWVAASWITLDNLGYPL